MSLVIQSDQVDKPEGIHWGYISVVTTITIITLVLTFMTGQTFAFAIKDTLSGSNNVNSLWVIAACLVIATILISFGFAVLAAKLDYRRDGPPTSTTTTTAVVNTKRRDRPVNPAVDTSPFPFFK